MHHLSIYQVQNVYVLVMRNLLFVGVMQRDLKEYKYLFTRSLETLVWLPAARIMAMEGVGVIEDCYL